MKICYFLFGLLMVPGLSAAQSDAVVEGLQQPAWVERGNVRTSLYPGRVLQTGDRVGTGKTGKLVLRLAEGSQVKLGVNMDLYVEQLESNAKSTGDVLTGFLRVVAGAIRFTTPAAAKQKARDFRLKIGAATIGIRGTDVWGKAAADKDFVVLIEGDIEVERPGDAPVRMATALTILDVPKGEAVQAVAPVNTVKLQQWALETELDQKQGVLVRDGSYIVYLLSTLQREYADAQRTVLQQQGYAATVYAHEQAGKHWFRLGIGGFASVADARWFAAHAQEQIGVSGAWVARVPTAH